MIKATKTACCIAAITSSAAPTTLALPSHVRPATQIFGIRRRGRTLKKHPHQIAAFVLPRGGDASIRDPSYKTSNSTVSDETSPEEKNEATSGQQLPAESGTDKLPNNNENAGKSTGSDPDNPPLAEGESNESTTTKNEEKSQSAASNKKKKRNRKSSSATTGTAFVNHGMNNDYDDAENVYSFYSSARPSTEKFSTGRQTSTNDDSPAGKPSGTSSTNKTKTPPNKNKTSSKGKNGATGVDSQEQDYYKIIGVPRNASQKEITKAYRRKCVQYHPDKTGGDRTMFDKLSEAYDVLSDETKKSLYDRFGKKGSDSTGPESSGAFFTNAQDVFSTFFGGSGASPFGAFGTGTSPFGAGPSSSFFSRAYQQQQQYQRATPRNKNMRYSLEVTLEDLYCGSTRRVTIAKPPSPTAEKRRPTSKEVEIVIEKGMRDGEPVILSGEIDSIPNATPADVVFLLSQTRHRTFTRKNNDLAVEMKITLKDALCGWSGRITHLDGRRIRLQTNPNDPPIQDGDVRVFKGEGMPVRGRPGIFGDLYVQFRLEKVETRTRPGTFYNATAKNNTAIDTRLTENERNVLGDLLDIAQPPSATDRRAQTRTQLKSKLVQLCNEYGVNPSDLEAISTKSSNDTSPENPFAQNATKQSATASTRYLELASAADFGTSYPGSYSTNADFSQTEDDDEFRRFAQHDPFEQFRFFSGGRREGDHNVQCQQM